jgi:hypothetical protein
MTAHITAPLDLRSDLLGLSIPEYIVDRLVARFRAGETGFAAWFALQDEARLDIFTARDVLRRHGLMPKLLCESEAR